MTVVSGRIEVTTELKLRLELGPQLSPPMCDLGPTFASQAQPLSHQLTTGDGGYMIALVLLRFNCI